MLITLIVFILILGLLVFVHEFGHFWVAKRSGITVKEFAFGFKPTLFSWKRGETRYAINVIPLGGYVHMEGEAKDTGKKGSFLGQPPGIRALVLVAGVTMNIILAWFLLTVAYGIGSYSLSPTFSNHPGVVSQGKVIVTYISDTSPAEQAGLKQGDAVVSINGQPIASAEQLTKEVQAKKGREITITYERNSILYSLQATPRENPPVGEGALGVGTGETAVTRAPWYKAPYVALLEVGSQIKTTIYYIGQFFSQLIVKQELNKDVSGIVGIGAATGIVRRLGVGPLLQFVAIISTNLAVVNLLPILPLDGGHLLFTAVEVLRKKPVAEKYRQAVALTGLVAILLLFFVITYQDIIRFSIVERLKNLF